MSRGYLWILLTCAVLLCCGGNAQRSWVTTDELQSVFARLPGIHLSTEMAWFFLPDANTVVINDNAKMTRDGLVLNRYSHNIKLVFARGVGCPIFSVGRCQESRLNGCLDDSINIANYIVLENHINPDDLRELLNLRNTSFLPSTSAPAQPDRGYVSIDDEKPHAVPDAVDCFGLGSLTKQLPWLFNMRPDSSDSVNTHFFFYSRQQPFRAQVLPGAQFGLDWVDFKPNRKTVMIVHGFMSHSNASWVNDMALAFLKWDDLNVITVDWSGGGNTWKYWRAVANTRRVGFDVIGFLKKVIEQTGARVKDFHFVGHSLGAHICSFASWHLGGVARITGLDPAQPCFRTSNNSERLDKSDANFVDIIHTNGRLLKKIGFGLPEPAGHADFYPNGGMKQPGCHNGTSLFSKFFRYTPSHLQQAICSHGRAYLLFTESLINSNCSFRAHRWNLSYEGVDACLQAACDFTGSCAEMGITAIGGNNLPRARGPYFVVTTEREPYCPTESELRQPSQHLLKDLREGFMLSGPSTPRPPASCAPDYADPDYADPDPRDQHDPPTTKRSWFGWWKMT